MKKVKLKIIAFEEIQCDDIKQITENLYERLLDLEQLGLEVQEIQQEILQSKEKDKS